MSNWRILSQSNFWVMYSNIMPWRKIRLIGNHFLLWVSLGIWCTFKKYAIWIYYESIYIIEVKEFSDVERKMLFLWKCEDSKCSEKLSVSFCKIKIFLFLPWKCIDQKHQLSWLNPRERQPYTLAQSVDG